MTRTTSDARRNLVIVTTPGIERNRNDEFCDRQPLSAAQEGIWLGQQLHGQRPLYNTAECVEICGVFNPVAFEQALRQTVNETETLHLRFDIVDGETLQSCDRTLPWALETIDFSMNPQPRQVAWAWMEQNLGHTVDLGNDKLFAQALLRLAPDHHLWYQRIHHIAIDGYGTALLRRRVADIYTALVGGEAAPPRTFGSLQMVIADDLAYRASEQFDRDRQYWLDTLRDAPVPVRLSSRMAPAGDRPDCQSTELSAEIFAQMQKVAHDCQAAWPDLLLATTAIDLHQITGAREVILGVPMMGRLGSVTARVPAMVMNIVLLRVMVLPLDSFAAIVTQISQRLRDQRPHQRYRYEQLRRDLKIVGGRVARPLFGPVVNVMPFDETLCFGKATSTTHALSAGPVEDLALNVRVNPGGGSLKLNFEANPARYDRETLVDYQHRWLDTLQSHLADPDRPIPFRSEQTNQTHGANTDAIIRGKPLTEPVRLIPDRLLEVAEQYSDTVAIIDMAAGTRLSYGDLITQARTLGMQLVAAGVQPDQLVAVHLPRSCEAVVVILAVLFSGAAYLPLDPKAPIARTVQLVNDANPVLAIIKTGYELPSDFACLLQYNLDYPSQYSASETLPTPQSDRLAYVIYTSGSTGQPKGVAIEHQALAQFTAAAIQCYGIEAGDRVLQFAGLHFDASVEEIFTSLCIGATLVLRDPLMLQSIPQFLRACEQHRITVLDLPTAFWHELAFYLAEYSTGSTDASVGDRNASELRPSLPCDLRMVIIGGEAALPQRVAQWHAAVGDRVTLWNTYGPSETTVVATAANLTQSTNDGGDVPIGRPLPGVEIVVIDALGQPVPIGESGELCVMGATLARGYLGRSQLTAKRFVPLDALPQRPRSYCTGDRVRLRPDGQLVFLGRLDAEFKISGHRVEPTEIEAVLIAIPGIREAAVIGYSLPDGGKRLCAYLVAASDKHPSDRLLRQQLTAILPAAIVPAGFEWLNVLPKTRSGKVDRLALAQYIPQWLPSEQNEVLPPLEAFILETWERVLGQSRLTLQDDFFELGGQSLQTIQVATWLGTKLGCDLPIALLFEYPTAAALAMALRSQFEIDLARLEIPDRNENVPLIRAPFAPLLSITPPASDKRSPWFCLHPAAGLSWCYLGLARALNQPLYGLQSPYLDGDFPVAHRTIQDRWSNLIDRYLALLRQAQPNGSYRLLGMVLRRFACPSTGLPTSAGGRNCRAARSTGCLSQSTTDAARSSQQSRYSHPAPASDWTAHR